MIPAINYAISALQSSERRLGVHGHNLANVNTPGFKFSRALQSTVRGGGTRISSIQANYAQGPFDQTNIPTDMAINGPGFFALENGSYTRNGAFSYDANGTLVSASGVPVIKGEVTEFTNPDGLVDVGESQFNLSEVSGQGFPSSSSIVNGALEASNVDIAKETVGTILAQRAFEANLVTIRAADEMTGTLLDIAA